jgi:hypothetical protein
VPPGRAPRLAWCVSGWPARVLSDCGPRLANNKGADQRHAANRTLGHERPPFFSSTQFALPLRHRPPTRCSVSALPQLRCTIGHRCANSAQTPIKRAFLQPPRRANRSTDRDQIPANPRHCRQIVPAKVPAVLRPFASAQRTRALTEARTVLTSLTTARRRANAAPVARWRHSAGVPNVSERPSRPVRESGLFCPLKRGYRPP